MTRSLELRQLHVFVAVVEAGGFGRAARALGIAQSSVSEGVAALERAVGAVLLTRSGRTLEMTPAGEALLPHARAMLRAEARALAQVARVARGARATVRVAAPESVTAWLLPAAAAEVRRLWPETRLHVQPAACEEVRAAVRDGRAEVGLVLEPPTREDAAAEPLAQVEFVLFAAPTHPLAGREASADELWRCRFAFSEPGGHYPALLRGFFEAAGYPMPAIEVLGSVEAARRMVLADPALLGALPEYALGADLREGRAARVHTARPFPPLLLRRVAAGKRVRGSPAAEALITVLRELTAPAR